LRWLSLLATLPLTFTYLDGEPPMHRNPAEHATPLLRCVMAAITIAITFVITAPARAADTTPASEVTTDKLAPARALIAEGRWRDAIGALQQVGDVGSADWNNLMGYSHRKAKTPDFAAAERYYDEALRLQPKHRGALEYSGELFLIMGDLPRAEARLAALDKACTFGCDEHKDLKAAVARYKANGNRYVVAP
jgi:tetratricopeptide (TPR) repeat protein